MSLGSRFVWVVFEYILSAVQKPYGVIYLYIATI